MKATATQQPSGEVSEALSRIINQVAQLGLFGPEIKKLIGTEHWSSLVESVQEGRKSLEKAGAA